MKNQKAQQREQLIMEFGILIQPFVELGKLSIPPDISKYRIASAKVQAGDPQWRLTAKSYCTFANDIVMTSELQKISHVNEVFLRNISSLINDSNNSKELPNLQAQCNSEINHLKDNFTKYISKIPVEWEPEIFSANTPFTAYLRIKESLLLVKDRIIYFDRYLKVEFYEIFLRNVDRNIEIKLITTSGNKDYGVNHVRTISNLVKKEFSNYQLIEVKPADVHDRNLIVDELVFNLGPGADRAGMSLTNFNPADNSRKAMSDFDSIIRLGNVVHQS